MGICFETEIKKIYNQIYTNNNRHNAKDLLDTDRNIYLVGRNDQSKELIGKINVNGIIDDFSEDFSWLGIPISKLSDITYPSIFINCSTSISSYDVYSKIRSLRSSHKVLNVCDLFATKNSLISTPWFVSQQRSEIGSNFNWWTNLYYTLADDVSRKTLLDVIRFRLTADVFHMKDYTVRIKEQYMEDFMEYSKEIFVDAGGYDGDTTEEFVKHCQDYKEIYFYEPSEVKILLAKKRLAGIENIHFKSVGLSDENTALPFNSSLGSASAFTNNDENEEVSVVTLDHDLKGVPVSFIKMDLEGWEMHALRGAEDIISHYKPKIAVAVYHDAKDLRQISEYLLNLNQDYSIYIRHYTQGWSETIMYFK
jgi:FkbM family methyltransferase